MRALRAKKVSIEVEECLNGAQAKQAKEMKRKAAISDGKGGRGKGVAGEE